MLSFNVISVIIILPILFLLATGNDNMSISSERGFVSSFAAKNIIASDVKQGQRELQKFITSTESFAESCPFLYFNTSKQCVPVLKNDLFDLYNLTEETKKCDLTAERENLRFFAETSSNNETISFMNVFGFFKECINSIYNLNEGQRCLIALCFLCAILKYKAVCFRPFITIIWTILLGKRVRVTSLKGKENIATDLLITPSERTILAQYENMNSSCDSRMDSTSSVENLSTKTHSIEPEAWECSDSWDCLTDESCDEEFPDEFFVFPCDGGNIGVMLGPGDWEKIETVNSSLESLKSDERGTLSTGVKSGQGYDVASEVDSVASSHCYCYTPVPMENASCLSYSSDKLPAMVYGESYNYKASYASSNDSLAYEYCCLYSEVYSSSDIEYSSDESETSESDIEDFDISELGNWPAWKLDEYISNGEENEMIQENITTLEQSVKNHAVALAIFAGAFVLPCFIAAKLLK